MRGSLILACCALLLIAGMGCTETRGAQDGTSQCLANCSKDVRQVCGKDNVTYANECGALCNKTQRQYEGPCGTCKDTDGGKNATVKGYVTSDGGNYTDYCKVFDSVEEYYCDWALAGRETVPCPEGYECHDGACVFKLPPIPEADCQDSDGKDIYSRGEANASGGTYRDSCVDGKKVKEYYCDMGVRSMEATCPDGYECKDSVCVKMYGNCTDTDDGDDIYNGGKVLVTSGLVVAEFLDKCLDGNRVREYHCSYGNYVSEDVECPKGYRCVQASCRQDVCTDSDGGYEIFRQGGTNKGDDLRRDECTGEDTGIEYYCDDNMIVSADFTCPAGQSCRNGRCED